MGKTKPEPTFTIDDLLAELRPDDTAEGWTIRELTDMADLEQNNSNRSRVKRKIDDLCDKGLWERAGKCNRIAPCGHNWPTHVYRPKGSES